MSLILISYFSRRSLLFVCKNWHRIVLSCLFEAIVILDQRGSRCPKLVNILEKYSLSHLVKRMDLYLQGPYDRDNSREPLGSLLRQCTNLRVLLVTLDHSSSSDSGYLDPLLQCILALLSSLAYQPLVKFAHQLKISIHRSTILLGPH
jgi:hypothetical protein